MLQISCEQIGSEKNSEHDANICTNQVLSRIVNGIFARKVKSLRTTCIYSITLKFLDKRIRRVFAAVLKLKILDIHNVFTAGLLLFDKF